MNGLLPRVDEVKILMQETYGKIDILGISETHLHAGIRTEEVSIDGYMYI